MNLEKIIQKITAETTARVESIHGIGHWTRVSEFGKILAERENINSRVLILFGYFHDCQRLNDGHDPEHGPRAARYVADFPNELLGLTSSEANHLILACHYHTQECETDDPVIRAYWDADRLDLTRIGIVPDPDRLFTVTAKQLAQQLVIRF